RLQQSPFKQCRINKGNNVSLVDARIKINIKFCDGPRHLRSYLDRDYGVDGSSGFHYVMDVTSFHFRCEVLRVSIPVQSQEDEQSSHNHYSCQDEPLAFCHLCPVPKNNDNNLVHSYRSASIGSSRDALRAG